MASRESLNRLPVSHLRQLLRDIGVVAEKLSKADIIEKIIRLNAVRCTSQVISNQSYALNALVPNVDGKENLPPFDHITYGPIQDFSMPIISFLNIYSYMVERKNVVNKSMNNFKGLDKAVKHFDAGDVGNIQAAKIDDSTMYLKTTCLASMKKIKYTVYLCMETHTGDTTIQYSFCHCPIGMAQTCSHIGAALFKINRGQGDSSTSQLCKWNVPRAITMKAIPLKEFNLSKSQLVDLHHERPKKGTIEYDPRHSSTQHLDIDHANRKLQELKKIFPKTGMAHIWNIAVETPEVSCEETVQSAESADADKLQQMNNMVFSAVNIPPTEIEMELVRFIERNTTGQSMCDVWKNLHRGRITSSLFGDVLRAGQRPMSLIKQIMEGSNMDRYASLPPSIKWGVENESVARDQYKQTFDVEVETTGLTLSAVYSFLGASSDGRVFDPTMPKECQLGVLEIKCPFSFNGVSVRQSSGEELMLIPGFYLQKINDLPHLNRSHKYYAQVQGEMAIMGLPWCDFYVWTEKCRTFRERIYFDADFVKSMLPKLVNFYMQHIFPTVMGYE